MQDFNQAIVVNPTTPQPISGAAISSGRTTTYDAALADLNQAIRLNPEGAQAYHARGLIYQRQGNNAQAITDFNNAIDRDPFAGAPYQARGQSFLATGQWQKAVDDFNAALNVDDHNSEAWASLGHAYEKLGNRAKAAEAYRSASSLNPGNAEARAGLARVGAGLTEPAGRLAALPIGSDGSSQTRPRAISSGKRRRDCARRGLKERAPGAASPAGPCAGDAFAGHRALAVSDAGNVMRDLIGPEYSLGCDRTNGHIQSAAAAATQGDLGVRNLRFQLLFQGSVDRVDLADAPVRGKADPISIYLITPERRVRT